MGALSGEYAGATPEQVLAVPVRHLSAIGPDRAQLLAKIGIQTARDLLFHFPRNYEDLSDQRSIDHLEEGTVQTVRGVVEEVDGKSTGFGRSIVGVLINDGTQQLRAIWFNQPYMRDKFHPGQYVMFSAKPKYHGCRWEMTHPKVAWLEGEDDRPKTEILPIYGLTEGIPQYQMRRMVAAVVHQFAAVPIEVFPESMLRTLDIPSLTDAIRNIHAPTDQIQLARARRRFIFQELFILQLALAIRRWQQQTQRRSPPLPASAKMDARILRLFPFELTSGQRHVIRQIASDMAQNRPMNRLLQGDVGSGKTVAAVYAMLLAVAHRCQAVMMAPTEILARQHAETLAGVLRASRVHWATLTGGTTEKERQSILTQLAAGEIGILIGTHALLQEDIHFQNLGLVVIDEQHKFGVRQRATLRTAGSDPHYLVMTATPIPRTLTMALFGDLDVSTLREMPPGRQQVHTYLIEPGKRAAWWQFVRDQLTSGRQAYIVSPLVDESLNIAAASAEETFEALANGELEAFRLDLIHGRMSSREKQTAMRAFRTGKTQVLVSTTVIEVGVDVPNATVLAILSPERFGLAQLHQLRGRICRGKYPGYCGLIGEPDASPKESELQSPALASEFCESSPSGSRDRLIAFTKTTDGFELAEIDFQMRGPGNLLGTAQHGLPPFRIADLVRDAAVVEEARSLAQKLIAEDPGLRHDTHAKLRRMVLLRYGKALDLGDVG
ncbi:MAG: ATP-dependent DNA helicase RecG [Pirellulales bacterium]|nr:ATP-dependent DNA helicase RecG [Pirellulales bacterium]